MDPWTGKPHLSLASPCRITARTPTTIEIRARGVVQQISSCIATSLAPRSSTRSSPYCPLHAVHRRFQSYDLRIRRSMWIRAASPHDSGWAATLAPPRCLVLVMACPRLLSTSVVRWQRLTLNTEPRAVSVAGGAVGMLGWRKWVLRPVRGRPRPRSSRTCSQRPHTLSSPRVWRLPAMAMAPKILAQAEIDTTHAQRTRLVRRIPGWA